MPDVPREIATLPGAARPLNLAEVIREFDVRLQNGQLENYRPAPLGFPEIDECLGGGLHAEDLALLGGVQNVGKTIAALQAARNMAVAGEVLPVMVCYEHGPQTLLHRLICLESVDDPDAPSPQGVTRAQIENAVLAYYDTVKKGGGHERLDLQWVIERLPGAERAWYRMRDYLKRLWLVQGDGLDTTVARLQDYVRMAQLMGFPRVVLIVDYAQRVPVRALEAGLDLTELQRIDLVMRGLKGIGLKLGVPVLAVAAADAEGLRQQRIHVENLWGPSTVQYEPDVALILNRDRLDGESGQRTVRLAIEKNRSGPSEVEFRHQLHGAYYCLSRHGERVTDEESFQAERVALRTRQQSNGRPGLDPTVATLLLAAMEKVVQADEEGAEVQLLRLFKRALLGDDGGASLMGEVAERFGLESLVEDRVESKALAWQK